MLGKYVYTVVIKNRDPDYTRVLVRAKAVLMRVETVLVRVEIVLVRVKMAEVLTSEYFDAENRIQSVILERIDRGCKREVMYTPLDLYFLPRIVALWRSGENIASIVHILNTEERKTTQQTIRRCKKKKWVSHAVSACFHLVAHYLESRFANMFLLFPWLLQFTLFSSSLKRPSSANRPPWRGSTRY